MKKPIISIIIPVYNEAATIGKLIEKVKEVAFPAPFEIIVCDDGSTDGTTEIIKKTQNIIKLFISKNKGKGYALRTGFKKAKGQILLIQDADLEYVPSDYLKIIPLIQGGKTDIVYGSRFLNPNHKPMYLHFYFGNLLLSLLTRLLFKAKITDVETCYKCFKRSVLKEINLEQDGFGFEIEFTCKALKKGSKITEVPISYTSRSYAQGKKIGLADGLQAIYLLFKYRFS